MLKILWMIYFSQADSLLKTMSISISVSRAIPTVGLKTCSCLSEFCLIPLPLSIFSCMKTIWNIIHWLFKDQWYLIPFKLYFTFLFLDLGEKSQHVNILYLLKAVKASFHIIGEARIVSQLLLWVTNDAFFSSRECDFIL